MNARATRGPGSGRIGGRRPPVRRGGGRGTGKPNSGRATAGLVLGMSALLTPLATRVWTTAMVPAADRWHYGDLLVPALALAGLALYALTSVLLTPRRTTQTAKSERKRK